MKRYIAKNGRHSSHNFILGTPGEDLKFEVPVGVTLITDFGKKIGELNEEGEELVIAKGGTGGHPKNGFLGTKGQAYPIKLDLKLIADIGLVGFPNAGKSTLLKAISQAKPKIASYPFTTVRPNLGILTYSDLRQISMADLPGLIEGAHANKGMGHQFLKHVERTKLILMIIDIHGFQLSPQYPHRSCLETIMLLIKELELYNEDLLNKPSMLLINKMDSEGSIEKYKEIKDQLTNLKGFFENYPEEMRPNKILKFCDIIPMSAKESTGDVDLVKDRLRKLLDVLADLEAEEEDKEKADLYGKMRKSMVERGPSLV
ncbi:GTP-binding protein 10 homolog isoform X2 [Anoplophora glabripennis]|nr:GTP-binding protein 10 homolog isoform X2 [Anoplophora glabripennis]